MGSVLTEAIDNVERPRVGLLNIGSEAMKGNAQVKAADEYLADAPLNYIGFVEGDDIYSEKVDVVVCDGFVGNISLKTAEGVAKLISYYMKEEFKKGLYNKLAGLVALPVLKAFRKRIDPGAYNGASLLGLKGIVIKSHGGADIKAYATAIEIAMLEVQKSVPQQIQQQVGCRADEIDRFLAPAGLEKPEIPRSAIEDQKPAVIADLQDGLDIAVRF